MIDLSIGGCAMFLPDDVPAMSAGVLLNDVRIELDADTRLDLSMRLQHVTAINADARGLRLGFEFRRVGGDTLRVLQRYIDLTQKRGEADVAQLGERGRGPPLSPRSIERASGHARPSLISRFGRQAPLVIHIA